MRRTSGRRSGEYRCVECGAKYTASRPTMSERCGPCGSRWWANQAAQSSLGPCALCGQPVLPDMPAVHRPTWSAHMDCVAAFAARKMGVES